MKNRKTELIWFIFIFICIFVGFKAMPVFAATTGTDANGFTWQSDDGVTYSITGYNGSDTNITIPTSIDGHTVTSIGNNAFKDKSLTSVTIPNTVKSIGSFAFYNCTSLVNISIPNSVTNIGDSAFAYCTSLPNITLPTNLSNIGNSTFQDCKAFTEITIPDSVTRIGDRAFLECISLTNITIPNSVTDIGEGAFMDCKALRSAVMPDSVTNIGNYLFYNCQLLSSVRLSNNLTDTGDFIFYNCFSLKGVTLPSNLTNIGNSAFENCTALTNITIPNGVTRIGYRAFIMCQVLANVTIPDTVKTIDFNAFAHCYAFTNIIIPDSVTSIGDYAFYYDTSLTEVTIPKSVSSIGFLTFSSCNSTFKIKGYGGSYAQTYANNNSLAFQDPNANTVTFNSEGGSAVGSIQANNNTLITVPVKPSKAGYTFGGWYKESAYITPWNFTTDIVTSNITLYVKWIRNPATPVNTKSVTTGYNAVNTNWNAVVGASGYELYRANSSTGTYSLVKATTSLNFVNTGLVAGTTYYYKVRAYVLSGTTKVYSGYSPIVSAKPVPVAPTGVKTVSTGYNALRTNWNAVAGASGYELYRASSTSGTYSLVKATTSLNFVNTGLITGKTYYYKVKAYRLVGTTKVYGGYSPIAGVRTVPAAPTRVKSTSIGHNRIRTSWNAITGASGYALYRASSGNGKYSLIKATTSLSFVNKGLIRGKTYYFKVRAYRLVGTTKVYSNLTSASHTKTY